MSSNTRRSRRRSAAIQRSRRNTWLRRYYKALRNGVAAASIGAAGLLGQSAHAATDTWIGNTDNFWATTANWNAFPQTGDNLVFGTPGSAGSTLIDNLTTTPTYTLGTITFNAGIPTYTINAASGTRGFTVNSGSLINLGTAAQNFNDNFTINTSETVTMTAGGGDFALGGAISGPGSIITSGAGALTMTGNSTFSGGVNVGAGTTLRLGRGTAPGTGAITISGNATIDNSSGTAMTLTNNNQININADLTFTGTKDLNLGTSTASTLGGAAGQRTVNVAAGNLSIGPIKSAAASGIGLIKNGPGTLNIVTSAADNAVARQLSIDGTLTVNGGTINMGQNDTFVGGLSGAGTVANGSNTTRWITVGVNANPGVDTTFSGALIDGAAGRLGLRKRGTGALTLTGTSTLSDQLTFENGTVNFAPTASIIPKFPGNNLLFVANTIGQKAILNIQGGTLQVQNVGVGAGAGNAGNNTNNVSGAIIQTGGTLQILNVANTNNFRIGDGVNGGTAGNGGYGYYNLSGVSSQANLAEFAVGGGNNSAVGNIGVMDMTGGTINDVGWITIARGNASTGIMNVMGTGVNNPVVNYTNAGGGRFYFGGAGGAGWYGVVNVSNATIQNPVGSNVPLEIADTAGGTGIVNLGPGAVFRAGSVGANNAGSTSYLNFTGGTLQAAVSNTLFLGNANNPTGNNGANLTGIVVYDDSTTATKNTIDNNGTNITVARPLSAPTGNGITSISVDNGGSGYIGAPAIVIANAPGAAAIANMISDGAGGLKIGSITITSPGTGVGTPTVTLLGGGYTTAATIGTTINTAPVVGGGMTFKGSGVATLSSSNTYTGPTTISGGTLLMSGNIDTSSAVNINGSGAKLVVTGSIGTPTVNVTNGRLDGTGSINTAVVGAGTGGIISNGGNGTTSSATAITINNLTFSGAGTWAPVVSDANAGSAMLNATTITTTGAGTVTVAPINTGGAFSNLTYTLANYTTLGGSGFGGFVAAVPGLGGRQTQTLNNTGSQITLTIGGNYTIWNGGTSGNWQLSGTPVWNLSSTLAATTYQSTSGVEDAVVFDDSTANGSAKTVSISSGNVAPPRVTFNNTSGGGNYTINGPSAITGSASLFVNNTGAVTLNAANTFTGGVTVSNGNSSGTLNIGNNTAIGTGPLTLGLNSKIDASGGNRALTNNNVQNWNGDFTFVGSNNLDLGTGAVTINLNANNAPDPITQTNSLGTTSTVNVAAGTLTVGGPLSGPGVSLVKTGAGKLVLNGPATYSGTTIIHNGELVTSTKLGTINQDIQISPGLGDNGVFTVAGGTVDVQRVIISGNSGNGGAGSGTATMNMSSGTVNCGQWFTVGSGNNAATQVDTTGTFNMSGGTLNINTGVSGAQFEIGNFPNMRGVVNQTGGDIKVFNGGNGIAMGANGGALSATYNMSGGTLTTYTNGGITPGGGRIRLNQGSAVATSTFNLFGGVAQVQGVQKTNAGGTGNFNFEGGTLKAGTGTATFMSSQTGFNVNIAQTTPGAAAIIDDNGVVITATANILHGAAGATDGGLTKQGSGTLALSGAASTYNGGTRINAGTLGINSGAALGVGPLIMNAPGVIIDNTSGAGITLTNNNAQNWNNDFVYAGSNSLNMGTGTVTLNGTRTVTTNLTNAGTTLTEGGAIVGSGFGIIKDGPGNLALTGTSTYTGPTSIPGGTLVLSGTGSINNSSGITVNGGRLLQTSSVAITPTVNVTGSTLDGTTTVNTVTVANSPTAVITHGNGTVSPITIGSLTFNGTASLQILTSGATASTPKIATTSVATSSAGNVVINASNTASFWTPGVNYAILSYTGSIGGAGLGQFAVGQFAGLGAHQTVTITNSSGVIGALIGGDTLIWTGALDGTWTTATQSAPKNWKLSSTSAPSDFFTNDAIAFPDGASTGTVNVTSNVSAASIQFTNTAVGLPYTIQGASSIAGGAVFINGGGTVSIANSNTYSSGTTINNGRLNINSATAIGTGNLTINGGTIDNTSAGDLTLTNNNTQTWNGSFTFNGTHNLNFGTGAVTLSGSSSLNVAAGDLTVGVISSAAGIGLTKSGPGTLTVNSTSGGNAAQSNIGGVLNITGGTVQIGLPGSATASDFNVGGLAGSGTLENGSGNTTPAGQARWVFVNNSSDSVFSGVLQDGAGGAAANGSARLGFNKRGAASQTLSGANTLSDVITAAGGNLIISGSLNPAVPQSMANVGVIVSATTAPNAVLKIAAGGNLNATHNNFTNAAIPESVLVGNGAGTAGDLRMTGGSLTSPGELWLATADGAYGAMDVSGGTMTVNSWLALGRGGGQGVINMSGGAINVTGNQLTIGSFGGTVGNGINHGLVNLSGGTITTANNVFAGEQTSATINVSGTGHLVVGNGGTQALRLAVTNATTIGLVNLLGGTISTPSVSQGAGQGIFNFNGGTLQATADNTAFMNSTGGTGTLAAYVYPGGAKIDDGGHAIQIDQPLLVPGGNGIAAGTLNVTGSGFASTPLVQITPASGDTTGVGASAVANIDANGNLTGFTITNPGTGYTLPPNVSLVGGGVGTTSSVTGALSLAANTSGGLTKTGTGTLTLAGASTYTGPTKISQGTLSVVSGVIDQTSKLIMDGGKLFTNGTTLTMTSTTLQATASSIIDMGNSGALHLANSSGETWATVASGTAWQGSLLRINNWSSGNSQIVLDGATPLTSAQLSQIHFTTYLGTASLANNVNFPGSKEVVPAQTVNRLWRGDLDGSGKLSTSAVVPTGTDLTKLLAALADETSYLNNTIAGGNGFGTTLSFADFLDIADVNNDGAVNNVDIQTEINAVINGVPPAPLPPSGGASPVPEPSSVILLGVGGALYLFNRYRRKDENS